MNVQNDVQKVIVLSDNETIILSDIDNLGVKPSSKLSLTSLRLEVGFFRVMNYCFAVRQVIHRSKIRVLKMLIVVVILFAFCWLPLYAVNIRLFFGPPMEIPSREFDLLTQIIIPLAQWLGLSSCSVNPVIYCLFSGKFRAGYRSLIVSASCCSCCIRSCVKEPFSASPITTSGRFFVNGNRSVFAGRASESGSGYVSECKSPTCRVRYGSTSQSVPSASAGGLVVAVHVIDGKNGSGGVAGNTGLQYDRNGRLVGCFLRRHDQQRPQLMQQNSSGMRRTQNTFV